MSLPVLSAVHLDSIDDGSEWTIRPFLPPAISLELAASCRRIGILRAPLVLENSNDGFSLLDGRQRVAIARDVLNLQHCPCLVIPATSSPRLVLDLLLESQTCSTPLSPMEVAHYLQLCRRFIDNAEDYAALSARVLPGKPRGFHEKRHASLLLLEDALQEMVHTLFLTETMALELLETNPEDRLRMADLFRYFGMGGGKQKRMFSLVRDIAGRNGTTITAVLDQPAIRDILVHREMNKPQKVHGMLNMLQQIASPSLTAAEDAFRQRVASLNPPSHCYIQHSQSFETDDVELTIRFSTLEHLEDAWPVVKNLLHRQDDQQ